MFVFSGPATTDLALSGTAPLVPISFLVDSHLVFQPNHGSDGGIRHAAPVATGVEAPRHNAHQDQSYHANMCGQHSGMPVA